jgi:hypothetical protein
MAATLVLLEITKEAEVLEHASCCQGNEQIMKVKAHWERTVVGCAFDR